VRWDRLLDRAPWKARAMPRGGQLDGFFYVLTGRAGTGTVFSDVWRSPDGIEWELVTAKAEWGKRCYPEVEIVDGVMVLVAGQDLRTFHNDVWRSTMPDGPGSRSAPTLPGGFARVTTPTSSARSCCSSAERATR
jgi:hypothetical protein